MEFLQNPNIVYLLLAGGLIFAVLALVAPGTGILEIGAIFILGVAGWAIVTYDMPINAWALILLAAGVISFFFAVRRPRQWVFLAITIIMVVLGSAFLFRSDTWYLPAVNPLLVLVVSVLSGGFFWLAARKVTEAASIRPTHDLEALVGATGEAKERIAAEGSVQVAGELWSARSERPIQTGARVRVVNRDGFTLDVEAIDPKDYES